MAITDQALLEEIQFHLVEDPDLGQTYPSALWTLSELIAYANERQDRFIAETGVVLALADLVTIPNVRRQALPTDAIQVRRVSFRTAAGVYHELAHSDSYAADIVLPTWTTDPDPIPQVWMDVELPHLHIQIAPPTLDAGRLEIVYVSVGVALTGLAELFTVPDECVPAIKWGILASALGKEGRAHDAQRAAYGELRYEEGIVATQLWMAGLGV